MTALVLETLDDNKAEEIVILPLEGKTDIARQMIVASGRSARHVGALADHLESRLRDVGVRPTIEGFPSCDWVLLDTGDIIVHLFRPEVRTYYNLEKMWGPAIAHLAAHRDGETGTGAGDAPEASARADFDPVREPGNTADVG
ncbi:ribosome silencing factor [Phaeovibrio sulfidiphilus]|uniref:Ribosomal silencing factor RsfS n=1 Tax=Phaeovibrio sulfidiphilus TaxID=1220600 RepID=A0A8J6YM08_9PROT|nr:ribosome silencing factor [Phaeovibrio sulfidiphilus]MBE1237195.1 ribosome silencing factor [Phaeovibrio sulfidiphilus]